MKQKSAAVALVRHWKTILGYLPITPTSNFHHYFKLVTHLKVQLFLMLLPFQTACTSHKMCFYWQNWIHLGFWWVFSFHNSNGNGWEVNVTGISSVLSSWRAVLGLNKKNNNNVVVSEIKSTSTNVPLGTRRKLKQRWRPPHTAAM